MMNRLRLSLFLKGWSEATQLHSEFCLLSTVSSPDHSATEPTAFDQVLTIRFFINNSSPLDPSADCSYLVGKSMNAVNREKEWRQLWKNIPVSLLSLEIR